MMPELRLSRHFAYVPDGPLTNDALLFSDDPLTGNRTMKSVTVQAPQPAAGWGDAEYIAAFATQYPAATITVEPVPDAD